MASPRSGQRAADQKAAVAIERLALGAHQADAVSLCGRHQPVETGAKFRLRRHRLVVRDAVAIERRVARATAELVAEKLIARRPRARAARRSALAENHGKRRDAGAERTSAMASTPAARNMATKRSAGMLEWPMVKRS